jgi:hypothetical protein
MELVVTLLRCTEKWRLLGLDPPVVELLDGRERINVMLTLNHGASKKP